ncbi:zinc-dependent alcohol dehydrogenase [Thermus igniterrae]|jgi:L-gulonate 5-dehydrogenase|uniref:zinc-dependent alcohol dehydrogenase n=1 Tax=Thermus igniterrae TaxID=88189 RepID=UPI000373B809|nr:alcohol dehydrogenase catalytic domain-containing protein [Thermus igniterrae]
MRAWVLRDYGALALEERPVPQGPGLLLRVVATGLCGSDLGVFKGTPAMRARWHPPLVLGHEVAGVVEEGPEGLLGQVVAVHPAIPCGTCPFCRRGKPHLCPERVHLGFHLPGGLAQWIRIPEGQVYPLPRGLPPWKGALAEPLAVVLHGARLGQPEPGEEALVLGGGALGGLAAWLLGRWGLRVSLREPNPARAEVLRRLGLVEEVWEGPPPEGGFPLVLDTVGLEATLPQALRACAPGGRVVVLGLGGVEAPLALQDLVLREKAVQGSYLFTPEEFAEAVSLLEDLPEALVRRWPAAEAQEAFTALAQGQVPEPKLVLEW